MSNLCLTCDNTTEYEQCINCNPEAYKPVCNNKLCVTPNSRIQNHCDATGYCDKCLYLSKNKTYFPTVQPINICGSCGIVVATELCWTCVHEQEECWCH